MVKKPAVVDSACLIGLERVGRLDLLPSLLHPVMAPPAVLVEFGSQPVWLDVVAPNDAGMVAALRLVVGFGESEAIALAYEKGTRIILDDRKAREAAHRLGISVTGTVDYLRQRAAQAKMDDFDRLLAMVPDSEPDETDRIPAKP